MFLRVKCCWGIALEIHVQTLTDERISGICFKLIMRGCREVAGVEIYQTGDELIILKRGGYLRAHVTHSTLICLIYTINTIVKGFFKLRAK